MSRFSFYCPFCFERIKACDIKFFCHKCKTDVARSTNILEKAGLMAPPRRAKCGCGTIATMRKCPNPACATVTDTELELPSAIDKLSDLFIAIIGAKGSGKSHYIALLIYRIKQLHNEFGWTLHELDDQTRKRYNDNFYKPLFEGHRALQSTQRARVQSDVNHPLLYSLNFSKGGEKRRVMLAFFDTAGEDLDAKIHEMTAVNKYIFNSSGIICLLDPLQLSKVRASVETRSGKQALPSQGTDTGEIINRVARLIEQGHLAQKKSKAFSKIKIPLAVAFSKIDAVGMPDEKCDEALLPESCRIFQNTLHRGIFHHDEFTTIHDLMETWIRNVDEKADILQQCKAFEYVGYFGLSALGCNPLLTGDKLEHDPRPMRVEDPFLWILHQNGLIKMKG